MSAGSQVKLIKDLLGNKSDPIAIAVKGSVLGLLRMNGIEEAQLLSDVRWHALHKKLGDVLHVSNYFDRLSRSKQWIREVGEFLRKFRKKL